MILPGCDSVTTVRAIRSDKYPLNYISPLYVSYRGLSYGINIPYFLDWNARVLLVSNELLAGVVFEAAFYSRAFYHNVFFFVYSAHYVRLIY